MVSKGRSYMFVYDNKFQNEKDILAFINKAEDNYKNQVLDIAKKISKIDNLKFLTLAGPSCSGKTTTSYILEEELKMHDITVKIVSIDDFYRDRADISDDEKPDYESISAIDFPVFVECVENILNGKTAMLPKFDFKSGCRVEMNPYVSAPHEIVVFEGIQAIYPEIIATLPRDTFKSIYICPENDVQIGDEYFDKREIRFYRRLVRDFLFRNATASRTLELWSGVVENEDKNIIPYGMHADFIINSSLAYELAVIKPFLLKKIHYDMNSLKEKSLFDSIANKFANIEEISERHIPKDSVFREFIGK